MNSFKIQIHRSVALLAAAAAAVHCLTSGPGLPEYSRFEPVEATDMVNLVTGNFAYSLPVMTVPGPGLGFPIVLNYHAGISQKEEASWVGLGWNLQAGAITRQVNKLPDDFKNIEVNESVRSEAIHGWTASIGYNGATIGITTKNGEMNGGFVGFGGGLKEGSPVFASMTVGLGGASGMTGVRVGLATSQFHGMGGDYGIQTGAQMSIGVSAGEGFGVDAGAGISMAYASSANPGRSSSSSLASVGVSLTTKGGLGGGVGVAGGATISNSVKGSTFIGSSSFFLPIPIPGYGIATFSFSKWRTWIQGYQTERHYGFLYADKTGMDCLSTTFGSIDCHGWSGSETRKRHEYLDATRPSTTSNDAKLMKTAEDVYMVAGQGVSGVFRPYRKEDGDYLSLFEGTSKFVCGWDPWNECGRRSVNRTQHLESSSNLLNSLGRTDLGVVEAASDVYWRFLDDPGGGEFTDPDTRDHSASISVRSRKIIPQFDPATNLLKGFKIRATNGVTYVFDFGLYNGWEEKRGYQDASADISTTQDIEAPYAYAWLLTSIQSVDYVDADGVAGPSQDDFGGWVKFAYGDGNGGLNKKPVQYWRTPYYDPTNPLFNNTALLPNKNLAYYSPNSQVNASTVRDNVSISSSRNSATGLKEIAYLHSIETPTHRADFTTVARNDNHPFPVPHTINLSERPNAWIGGAEGFNWRALVNLKIKPGIELYRGLADTRLEENEVVHLRVSVRVCGIDLFESYPQYHIGDEISFTANLEADATEDCASAPGYFTSILITSSRGTTQKSRALSQITLTNKAMPTADGAGIVQFFQDYTLCPNTPNSKAATNKYGKLTLNAVNVKGSLAGPSLPSYRFYYGFNPSFQKGLGAFPNVTEWYPWEKSNWDRWGNYCRFCTETFHEPFVPDWTELQQAAWSMDRIVTPSGGQFAIKYDAKRFKYVGAEPVATVGADGNWETLAASGGADILPLKSMFRSNSGFPPQYTQYTMNHFRIGLATIKQKLAYRGYVPLEWKITVNLTGNAHREIALGLSSTDVLRTQSNLPSFASPISGTTKLAAGCGSDASITCANIHGHNGIVNYQVTIPNTAVGNNDQLWLGLHGFEAASLTQADYRLVVKVARQHFNYSMGEDYADGVVAREVEYREPFSNVTQTVQYAYEDGSTSTLPGTFSDYSDAREASGRGADLYAGNPGVYYGKVTMTVNGKNKTVYSFLTPRDLPVMHGVPSLAATQPTDGSQLARITVADFSALWGSLYKKEEFKDGTSTVVRMAKNEWAYNRAQLPSEFHSQLAAANISERHAIEEYPMTADGSYYLASTPGHVNHKNYFGHQLTVASHRFFGPAGCYVDNCPHANIRTTQVAVRRFLPSQVRTITETDDLRQESENYYQDFRTGAPLKTRTTNSDNSTRVTETVPAYFKYAPMGGELNMLEQVASSSSYLYSATDRPNAASFLTAEDPSKAIASEVTMWRPYDRQANRAVSELPYANFQSFRKWRTYTWNVDLSTGPYLDFPYEQCYDVNAGQSNAYIWCGSAAEAGAGSDWKLTSQVNRYDIFGHALDVQDARNRNFTTLYGYAQSLPVAFVENTKIPDNPYTGVLTAFYESFERAADFEEKVRYLTASDRYEISPAYSKTGSSALVAKWGNGSTSVCFDIGRLEPHTAYEASVWYYDATDGTSPTDANATRPGIFLGGYGGCGSENHPNGEGGVPIPGPGSNNYSEQATGSKKWKRLSTIIKADKCPDQSRLSPAVACVYASKNNTGRSVYYDELRVRPLNSMMSTYAYDHRGRMTHSADARETVTGYEYDDLGNLTGIRNDDGVLVSEQHKKTGSR